MTVFVAIFLMLGGMLVAGLLFATSSSIRSLVRCLCPEHESAILLPADDWYKPQNVFGNLRPIALFAKQPPALMSSPAFRSSLVLARILLVLGLIAPAGALVCALAA